MGAKAKRIFRNSGFSDNDWIALEKMIEKIMADCMGGELYNRLFDKLDGKTLIINFNPNTDDSTFNFTNGTVTIGVQNGAESNRLLHEMFHAYQAYGETEATYRQNLMNIEWEARIAQYMYISKLPEFQPGSKWYETYTEYGINSTIPDLVGNYLTPKGELRPDRSNVQFNSAFSVSARKMQNAEFAGWVNPYKNYPYNHGRAGTDNIKSLRELSKNCK